MYYFYGYLLLLLFEEQFLLLWLFRFYRGKNFLSSSISYWISEILKRQSSVISQLTRFPLKQKDFQGISNKAIRFQAKLDDIPKGELPLVLGS